MALLSHQSKLFGVNDAALFKMLTDPPAAPPTYSSKVDVVGVKSLTAQLSMAVKTLRGDNTLLAADAVFQEIKGDLKFAKFNFDALAAATTATVSDTVGPPGLTKTTLSQFDLPANIKIEAQSKQVDYIGGDVHFILWKCIGTSFDAFGFNEEDYNTQGISYTAFPLIGTPTGFPANSWASAVANETAIAIT